VNDGLVAFHLVLLPLVILLQFGLDVAIEALKDCLRQKKASINEIYRYAKGCRVSNVIRPLRGGALIGL